MAGANSIDWDSRLRGTVYGVLLNHARQVEGLGDALSAPPYGKPPRAPVLYIKPPGSWNEDDGEVVVPAGAPALEANGTLAVVIGRSAGRVSEAEALDHVLGYGVAIDICIPHSSLHRPSVRQRARDGFLPMSRQIVLAETIADPGQLAVRMRVNGRDAGAFALSEVVRPVRRLIADVSEFMTLAEGDVLLAGLALDAPLARAGDVVEAEIDGVGSVSCRMVAEGAR